MSDFRKRILEPLEIPVAAIVFIGGLVWGLSRFLLVTDKDMAVVIAFVLSFMILVVASFLSQGDRFGGAQKVAVTLLGIGIAAGGSVTAATIGIRPFEGHVKEADFVLVAKGIAFVQKQVTLSPDEKIFNVELDNQDAGTPHNFAMYRDAQHTQAIFKGPQFPGVAREPNQFANPGPGLYFFQCDVHPIPAMQGIVSVGQPAPGGAPLPGGSPSPGSAPPAAPGPAGPGTPNPAPSPSGQATAGSILGLPLVRRRTASS